MSKLRDFMAKRAGNDLGHVLFGMLYMLPVFALGVVLAGILAAFDLRWVATAVALFAAVWAWDRQFSYYLGRERGSEEIRVNLDPISQALEHWDVREWGEDERADLLAPAKWNALTSTVYAVLLIMCVWLL